MSSTPPEGLLKDEPLGRHCTLGTGGRARYFVEARDEPSVSRALAWARDQRHEVLVLGGGSNLVIADHGVDALVLKLANQGVRTESVGGRVQVTAAGGEDWDRFVAHVVERGWAGLECLSGIPGRVGATPIQNVGAYGQEVSDSLVRIRCLDRVTLETRSFSHQECRLAYRDSRFKHEDRDRFVVLDATFRLVPGGAPLVAYGDLDRRTGKNPTLNDVRQAVLAARAEKSMLLDPNDPNGRSCGSFFVNPILTRAQFERIGRAQLGEEPPHYPQADGRVKVPAAWLIEQAGVRKGQRVGNVGISSKHALAIVAHAGARSTEVRDLAVLIKQRVRQRFGVELEAEPRFVGLPAP
jgi:UDP-N-acetylmuramate dehydrogenase